MSLQQDIVVVNEFTHNHVKTPGKGSRGGTIGNYILQYVIRESATETLNPVQVHEDGSMPVYNRRYALREETTRKMKADEKGYAGKGELKEAFRQINALSGRSFGNRGLSLSEQTLRYSSAMIQQSFDDGRVANKIVLSFTEDYLKEHGIVDDTYQHNGRGSYKGNIDQLKLRHAVSSGMDRMLKMGGWSEPEWVGSIQVDTNQVHAHIALADKELSPKREIVFLGKLQDRGKLSDREMIQLRRGIHYDLVDMKSLSSFNQSVSIDRQNVSSFVKDYAYDQIERNAKLQVLVASLPENKQHWRYGTNREDMKRPNELATEVVQDLFLRMPDKSGYARATRSVYAYAESRQSTEGFNETENRRLIENGLNMIEERSVNALYESLKDLDKERLPVHTVMLDVQSANDEDIMRMMDKAKPAQESDDMDIAGFELRVRGYSRRHKEHKSKSTDYKQLIDEFDDAEEQGVVSDSAYALRRFYEEELEWNMRLTDKYRYFFKFSELKDLDAIEEMTPQYEALNETYASIYRKDSFLEDTASDRFFDSTPYDQSNWSDHQDELNDYIQDVYGVENGVRALSPFYRGAVVDEVEDEKERYGKQLRSYTFDCFSKGVLTSESWIALSDTNRILDLDDYRSQHHHIQFIPPSEPKTRISGLTETVFNDVKYLDIHHLGADYYGRLDRSVSEKNASKFAETMQYREAFEQDARRFLESTGQQAKTLDVVKQDIDSMRETVDYLSTTGQIPVIDILSTSYGRRNSNTVRLDENLNATQTVASQLDLFDAFELDDLLDSDSSEAVVEQEAQLVRDEQERLEIVRNDVSDLE